MVKSNSNYKTEENGELHLSSDILHMTIMQIRYINNKLLQPPLEVKMFRIAEYSSEPCDACMGCQSSIKPATAKNHRSCWLVLFLDIF